MPHVLHLITDPTRSAALEIIAHQAQSPTVSLSIVLLHDAARLGAALPGQVFRLDEGRQDGTPADGHSPITHARLLDLIFSADTVVSW